MLSQETARQINTKGKGLQQLTCSFALINIMTNQGFMSCRDSNSGGTFSQHHATVAAAIVAIMSLDTRIC